MVFVKTEAKRINIVKNILTRYFVKALKINALKSIKQVFVTYQKANFNNFFKDGGEYKNFVNNKDESLWPKIFKDKKKAGTEVEEGVIVRVLRSELKKKMMEDKILPQ